MKKPANSKIIHLAVSESLHREFHVYSIKHGLNLRSALRLLMEKAVASSMKGSK